MEYPSDEFQLIEKCKEGDRHAQKAVYERYAPAMLAVCVRYVADRESAKDVLQDGFIKVFTSIRSYSGEGSFGAWVRRIFVTTSLEHLRKNRKWNSNELIDNYIELVQTEYEDVLSQISANELIKHIGALPERYRVIFNLFAVEGYAHAEIAEILNINENSSRSEFSRARKMLQKSIENYF